MMELAEQYRLELLEHVAEQDEALMEKYFETGDLDVQEIKDMMCSAIRILPKSFRETSRA